MRYLREHETHQPRPRFMYHVTQANRDDIEAEGLRTDAERRFAPTASFNRPGVYLYDDIRITRRLWPRSRVELFRVDTEGLHLKRDQWGGEGSYRVEGAIEPERITHIYRYEPFEKALVEED